MFPDCRYATTLDLLRQAANLAEVGMLATTLEAGTEPNLDPWLQQAVQARYHDFTLPAMPDGPEYRRPNLAF